MMLFLVRPLSGDEEIGAWDPWYDKCFGALVRAESQGQARALVAAHNGDEGKDVWFDPLQTTCTNVDNLDEGEAAVLLRSFASA